MGDFMRDPDAIWLMLDVAAGQVQEFCSVKRSGMPHGDSEKTREDEKFWNKDVE